MKYFRKFEIEDEIERCVWEDSHDITVEFLMEEFKEKRSNKIHYEFQCPYCSFRSKYFYCVDLHTLHSRKCYLSSHSQPCYPINLCYDKTTKRQFIP